MEWGREVKKHSEIGNGLNKILCDEEKGVKKHFRIGERGERSTLRLKRETFFV